MRGKSSAGHLYFTPLDDTRRRPHLPSMVARTARLLAFLILLVVGFGGHSAHAAMDSAVKTAAFAMPCDGAGMDGCNGCPDLLHCKNLMGTCVNLSGCATSSVVVFAQSSALSPEDRAQVIAFSDPRGLIGRTIRPPLHPPMPL